MRYKRALLRITLLSAVVAASCICDSQQLLDGWFARSDRAKADQPHWMTPVVTVTPRLEQEFRTDFVIEQTRAGRDLVNFGNSKGLELIPSEHVELILNVPHILNTIRRRCAMASATFRFWVNTGFSPATRIVGITL